MLRPSLPVNSASVARATFRARHYTEQFLQNARRLTEDSERAERCQAQLCVFCYYINHPRIGGAAITTQPCGMCQAPQVYASTATDVLCLSCAQSHELCKRCGADIALRKNPPISSLR